MSTQPAGPAPGLVLVSHSPRLAEGLRDLVEQVSQGRVRVAVAAGAGDGGLGTDPLAIARAVEEAAGGQVSPGAAPEAGPGAAGAPGPVLVLMDLGSALLSAEMALELLPDGLRGQVVLCDAPMVEGAVAAAAVLGAGGGAAEAAVEARRSLDAKRVHLAGTTGGAPPAAGAPGDDGGAAPDPGQAHDPGQAPGPGDQAPPDARGRVRVVNPLGLHARPAARFVQAAAGFASRIRVRNLTRGGAAVDATSPTQVALLDARGGDELELAAWGPDAGAAVRALRDLVASGFGEGAAGEEGMPGAGPADASGVPAELRGAARILRGVPGSPGVAVGRVVRLAPPALGAAGEPPSGTRPAGDPAGEWVRLDAARAHAAAALAALAGETPQGSPAAEILGAQRALLEDGDLLEQLRVAVFDRGLPAAAAWQETLDGLAARYRQAGSRLLRERAVDVEDLRDRVLAALAGAPDTAGHLRLVGDTAGEPAILVAGEVGPAALMALGRMEAIAGLCLAAGGPTAHAVILARSLGLPAAVGVGAGLLAVSPGTPIAVDGDLGLVVVEPGERGRRALAAKAQASRRARREAEEERHRPVVLRGGRRVEVAGNAAGVDDVVRAMDRGAQGIGLLRTEFLFLDRSEPPGEDEQLAVYRQILAAAAPHPVIIRTLDAGGDKPVPYLAVDPEDNPFLGVRGLRLSLARPDVFRTQLRAVLRAAREAGPERVRLMFPMVSTPEELDAALAHLEDAGGRPPGLQVGVMVEVPAAALTAGHLAEGADFFSVGSNDLTQYVLAAERGNAALAGLQDPLHPAVLALISRVIEAAHRRGRWVGVCGEMAGEPAGAAVLVGLGVDELSMAPARIPEIKAMLRRLDQDEAAAAAREALGLPSAAAVRAALHRRLPVLPGPSFPGPP